MEGKNKCGRRFFLFLRIHLKLYNKWWRKTTCLLPLIVCSHVTSVDWLFQFIGKPRLVEKGARHLTRHVTSDGVNIGTKRWCKLKHSSISYAWMISWVRMTMISKYPLLMSPRVGWDGQVKYWCIGCCSVPPRFSRQDRGTHFPSC